MSMSRFIRVRCQTGSTPLLLSPFRGYLSSNLTSDMSKSWYAAVWSVTLRPEATEHRDTCHIPHLWRYWWVETC